MTTITLEIDEEKNLPEVLSELDRLGLKYHINEEEDEWGGLSEAEIESIKAGLADAEAGRTHSHEYVKAEMEKLINEFRKKNAS
jgi:predicted transcriptional regulator